MTYETLKNEIAVWQLVTELKKEKQALPVSLSLTGNAEETALEVPAEDLGKADNMEKPTAQLDFFSCDGKDKAHEASRHFEFFKRTENIKSSRLHSRS